MASGWWDNSGAISGCVAAYQPIGAADLAASYVNLQNPGTYNAAPGVAPTFDTAEGWVFNGSTQWLDSGITRGSGYTMIVRVYATSDGVPMGGLDNNISYFRVRAGDVIWFSNNSFIAVAPSGIGSEMVLALAGKVAYRAGSTTGTVSGSDAAGSPISFGVAKPNHRFCACKIRAAAVYSGTLTAGEIAALTTLMNALPVAAAKGLPIIAYHHRQVFGG